MSSVAERYAFGSAQWFEMMGQEMQRGLARTPQAPGYAITFVERYHGAPPRADGTLLGFRIDIRDGVLSFRPGAFPDEVGDLVIDADVEVMKRLAVLKTGDPAFQALIAESFANGAMKVTGEREMGSWSDGVHDAICDRTLLDGTG